MPRPINRQLSPKVSDGNYDLELQIGATEGGASREELEVAWRIRRQELMEHSRLPGTRPWAFWVFELGEEPPRGSTWPHHFDETVRLAELGELDAHERAALAEKANEARMRLGTPGEQHNGRPGEGGDTRTVELWDAIKSTTTGKRRGTVAFERVRPASTPATGRARSKPKPPPVDRATQRFLED